MKLTQQQAVELHNMFRFNLTSNDQGKWVSVALLKDDSFIVLSGNREEYSHANVVSGNDITQVDSTMLSGLSDTAGATPEST